MIISTSPSLLVSFTPNPTGFPELLIFCDFSRYYVDFSFSPNLKYISPNP